MLSDWHKDRDLACPLCSGLLTNLYLRQKTKSQTKRKPLSRTLGLTPLCQGFSLEGSSPWRAHFRAEVKKKVSIRLEPPLSGIYLGTPSFFFF